MQLQKVKFTSVQINMKQVSYNTARFYFLIQIMLKRFHTSFSKGPFDKKGVVGVFVLLLLFCFFLGGGGGGRAESYNFIHHI